MKKLKYPLGNFLEIDDLHGARKVVMVGRDGITFWDAIDIDVVTPIIIHPAMSPVDLGTLMNFVKQNALLTVASQLVQYLHLIRPGDSLFAMRTLWCLAKQKHGDDWSPGEAEFKQAIASATDQEALALKNHEYTFNYYHKASNS